MLVRRLAAAFAVALLAVPALALAAHPRKGATYFTTGPAGAGAAIVSKKGGEFTKFSFDSHCANLPVDAPPFGIGKRSGRFGYHGPTKKQYGPFQSATKGTIAITGRFTTAKKLVFNLTYKHGSCTDTRKKIVYKAK